MAPRHQKHNQTGPCGSLTTAQLEPVGLARSDGKRPDGVTLVPWKSGKCLLWDFTCANTLAASYLKKGAMESSAAAALAEHRKSSKYRELESQYIFQPIAVETFGAYGKGAYNFVTDLGRRLREITGENGSVTYLRQSISMAIKRGNAMAVQSTLPFNQAEIETPFY